MEIEMKPFSEFSDDEKHRITVCIAKIGVRYDFTKFELAQKIRPIIDAIDPICGLEQRGKSKQKYVHIRETDVDRMKTEFKSIK